MAKIDTRTWGKFRIGDLFEISRPIARSQAQYAEGDVPFVASGNFNNGVAKWYEPKDGESLDRGNCITVSPLDGSAFYQKEDFLGRGGAGSAILILRNESLNESNGLFISAVIRHALTTYNYSNQLNSKSITQEHILLPVSVSGNPDWIYMSTFMSEMLDDAKTNLGRLTQTNACTVAINTHGWERFLIGDLFRIEKGTRLTRAKMREGDTPFIGATLENNGITAHVGNTEHVHPGGVMTVAYNGQKAMGKAFWQPEPFWASDDVNVLYSRFKLTREIALFLQPLFWEASKPFSYDDKWSKEAMERTSIMLPVTPQGKPDWTWMHQYITQVLEKADRVINAYQC